VASGEEGCQLAFERRPDLVILDLTLPGIHGYEVCERLRRRGLVTPVLMLTAQEHESCRVRGFEAGADDYVTKPFSLRELLGRVRAILRRSEGRADIENQRELDEARQIQQRLMPAEIPQISGLRIAGSCRPARLAGGDYFDVLKLEEEVVAVCVADVCGKGMPAAMMMSNLQAAVKMCASRRMGPAELCGSVNRVMCENIAGQGFITFFCAIIDTDDSGQRRCTYCNAGHNPPILVKPTANSVDRLDCGGGVLGVFGEWAYEEKRVPLGSGDRIFIYTDGMTESRNAAGEDFGEARLIEFLLRAADAHAAQLIDRALAEAIHFTGGTFDDDVTVVGVSVD
jgi:sigma-B regulation protein RsbU (phosphoserine phosphatase)